MMKKVIIVFFFLLSSVVYAQSQTVRISCVGASITEGYGTTKPWSENSYPALLGKLLGTKYHVENYGRSGCTMLRKGNSPYWDKEKYEPSMQSRPDIVLIDLGGNDAKLKNRIYKNDFVEDACELIRRYQHLPSHPRVILMTAIPGFTNDTTGIWDKAIVRDINPLIIEAARKMHIEVLDMHPLFEGLPQLLPDAIHPNDEGAHMIAQKIANFLKAYPKKPTEDMTIDGLPTEEKTSVNGHNHSDNSLSLGERGQLFKKGKYAMFIHWGLFSELAGKWDGKTYYGVSEWILNRSMANIDRREYMAAARHFNPQDFDAMKIAQLAKDAGMRYIVITSKHHEGFAMFHSSADAFNIYDATPFKRDPLKELSEACTKLGLGLGIYYSHNYDWTYPGATRGPKVDAQGNSKTIDDYFHEKCLPQVEEITKNYGKLELIWFDMPSGMPKEYAEKLVAVVRRNQPHALISSRIGHNLGDYQCLGDMEVPFENVEGLWESVDVTNDTWGYAWYDQNWKSPKQILQLLLSTIARGGTYMLNVGPDGKGNIPEMIQQSLREAGKWIARYPQVIYESEPSPWKHAMPWGDVIKKGNKLYLMIYEWPRTGRLYLPGLKNPILSAKILGRRNGSSLHITQENGWTKLSLPYQQPDALVNVIELKMQEANVVVDNTLAVDTDYGLENVSVQFAETNNCHVNKISWAEKFGEWKHVHCCSDLNEGGSLSWTVDIKSPGLYQLALTLKGNNTKVVCKIESDEGHFVQNQQRAVEIPLSRPMGWMRFDRAGRHTISVSLPDKKADVSLCSISIIPVETLTKE